MTTTRTPAVCASCARPMRPRHIRAADRPGTIAHQGRGLCVTCYATAARADHDRLTHTREEIIDELAHLGPIAPERAAAALGMTPAAIGRTMYRAGRPDLARPFWRAAKAARRAVAA